MSIQAVSWVLDHSVTVKLERLVLISLANHANEAGECWPSIKRIASEAGTSPLQARRTLIALEEGNHIARRLNAAPDVRIPNDKRPNLYRILDGGAREVPPWWNDSAQSAESSAQSDTAGVPTASERGRATSTPNHHGSIIDPSVEPSLLDADAPSDDSFETFWRAYPRKVGKPAARKAWGKAVKAAAKQRPDYAVASIVDAAIRYREDPNRQDIYTPYPQKWLNEERWNDPALPSRFTNGHKPAFADVIVDRSGETGAIDL